MSSYMYVFKGLSGSQTDTFKLCTHFAEDLKHIAVSVAKSVLQYD